MAELPKPNTDRSLLHRMDPRTKIFAWTSVFVLLLIFNHPAYVLGVLVMLILFAASAGFLKSFLRLWPVIAITVTLSISMWAIAGDGDRQLISAGPFRVTYDGLRMGLVSGLRFTGVMLASFAFISLTRPDELHSGLTRLGMPYSAAFVFSLAYRLVPLYLGVATDIVDAQTARGLDLRSGSIASKIRKYCTLAVPLLVYAVRSAKQMTIGLWIRGFTIRATRSSLTQLKLRSADYLAILCLSSLLVSAAVARAFGLGVST